MKRLGVAALVLLFVASSGALARNVVLDSSRDSQLMNAGCGGNSNKGHGGKFFYSVPQGVTSADTVLLGWDLGGVTLAAGEYVASGTVSFYSAGGGNNCVWTLQCYPMKKTWVEGVGVPVDGFGGGSYPWGPTSVGDSCQNYQVVSTVGPGSGSFATEIVATAGTAWHALGATGANDCDTAKPMTTGTLTAVSVGDKQPLGGVPLTAVGCGVVEDWIDGSVVNNGMVMILTSQRPGGSVMHLATREYACTGPAQCPGAYAPELEIEILPEPASMALLGLGAVVLFRRRKRK